MKLRSLLRLKGESFARYAFRMQYSVLRRVHPKKREEHNLSALAGPVGVWDHLERYQMSVLLSHGLKPHHSFLDVGCGPLTVGLPLIKYLDRGNYVGIDLRHQPLAVGYRRIAEASLVHKNPILINSHTFGGEELDGRRFDYVWMSQLSYHLDDRQMSELCGKVRARLGPEGLFLFDIIDPETVLAPGTKWSGLGYHVRPLEFFKRLASKSGFSLNHLGYIRDHGYPQHIPNLKENHLLGLRPFSTVNGQGSDFRRRIST